MMAAACQVVREPQRSERSDEETLAAAVEVLPMLRRLERRRFSGEVTLRGCGALRISLFEGAIAWVRSDGYPENLGDVLRRECGLCARTLQGVIAHCKVNKLHFGEGLIEKGLIDGPQLRDCLQRHLAAQLSELLTWPGPLSSCRQPQTHRYDHRLTFSVGDLLVGSHVPSASEWEYLEGLVHSCREQLPKLLVVAVADAQTGEMFCGGSDDQADSHAVLSLCGAGVRRLANNRITGVCDGPATDVAVGGGRHCVLVHRIAWCPRWLLVLGGGHRLGRLLSVALSADLSPGAVPAEA